jgi:IS5 family transposase
MQLGLSEDGFERSRRATRRQVFLSEMDRVIPWSGLEDLIRPHYPALGRGRQPYPLASMLRIHLMQQWFGYADQAMEEALIDQPLLRRFAGLDAGQSLPDETTILRFRRMLEDNQLAPSILGLVNHLLSEQGLLLRRGTVVDATLIAAPPSTKNEEGKRDPDMSQTKKGNQWYFGMKAHIGADLESGLVHTVISTTAKIADITQTEALLHGREKLVIGDGGYHRKEREVRAPDPAQGPKMITPYRRKAGQDMPLWQRQLNTAIASIRSKVEHPFRVIKRQFGYTKVRYRGLSKNHSQITVLFALSNLYQARGALLAAG